MSKAKMEAARELIREKRYEEARSLLDGIDHPTAKEWIAKIDERLAPAPKPVKRKSSLPGCLALTILVIAIYGVINQGEQTNKTLNDAARGAGEQLATAGLIAQNRAVTPATATLTVTASQTLDPSITPTVTNTPSQTLTVTLSPTITATLTAVPSATITDTPPPSATTATVESALESGFMETEGVQSVDVASVTDGEIVYVEVNVEPGYNNEATATRLRQVAHTVLVDAGIEFSVILNDGAGATDYMWSNREDAWTVTQLTLFTPEPGLMMTMEPTIYTTTGGANLRSCPRRDCDPVMVANLGSVVTVVGAINGEAVELGNNIWYVVEREGKTAYVYSTLVRMGTPVPTQIWVTADISTLEAKVNPPPMSTAPAWNCTGDIYNCGDFSSRGELMSYFNSCPGDPSRLDQGGVPGVPCED